MELDFQGLTRSFKIIKTNWFNKLMPRVHVKVHVQKLKTFFISNTHKMVPNGNQSHQHIKFKHCGL